MAEQDTTTAQAAAQTDDKSGQAAVGGEGTQGDQGDKGADKGKPFNPEQEAYIGSWMGRIIKKQFEENVLPHIRQVQPAPGQQITAPDEAMKIFNEKVQEKLFSGDAVGAMDMVLNLKEKVKQNLTQNQSLGLMRGLTTYSDKPDYEDIQPEMQRIAKERIAEGWPVDAALRMGYAEARSQFLDNRIKGGDRDHKGLNLSGGGKQPPRNRGPIKLPENYEKACARDIADGLYPNRDAWIKGLSPKIKEALGI